jgi:hypothetical protein
MLPDRSCCRIGHAGGSVMLPDRSCCRIGHAGGVENAIAYLVVIGLAGLAVFAFIDDPHWCSKDGRRFLCRVLPMPDGDVRLAMAREDLDAMRSRPMLFGTFGSLGRTDEHRLRTNRWLECRASIDADDTLQLFIRRGYGRKHLGPCRVIGRGEPHRNKVVFVIDAPPQFQMRIPAKSRAVATLAALITD